MKETPLAKGRDRTAWIGNIAQGHVGLPNALLLQEAGFQIAGFDVDPPKVQALREGESFVHPAHRSRAGHGGREEPQVHRHLGVRRSVRLRRHRHLCAHAAWVAPRAERFSHPRQRAWDREAAVTRGPPTRNFGPSSTRAASLAGATSSSPSRRIAGTRAARISTRRSRRSWWAASTTFPRPARSRRTGPASRRAVAESAKLLENVFRSVDIALANELKTVIDRTGTGIWAVIEAARTKPFGFMPFCPGPGSGSGGHWIPLDPFYLS